MTMIVTPKHFEGIWLTKKGAKLLKLFIEEFLDGKYDYAKDKLFIPTLTKEASKRDIDYNKWNCNKYNLITLCRVHNSTVNWNREFWQDYFSQEVRK